MALSRLKGTGKKLNKMPLVKQEYQATIEQYLQKGYIRKVTCEENTHNEVNMKWYLPHFPVVRLDKDSTKVRIVFDASAKIKGVSLNDFIHEGPKLQNELFNVILRFRKHPVAVICDISEMYLQIGLSPEDRPFHRFLWKSEITPPEVYEFNRVVFGVNASPFLAMFVSRKNAELYKSDFPLAAETVLLSTYMDDSMDSVLDEETGIQLYTELSALWQKAGMFAKKWLSNSTAVMEQIPLEDRAKEVDLNCGHLPTKKTLGVMWQAEEDVFTFKVHLDVSSDVYTKRFVLKTIAKLFDLIGLLSPFIIQGKIILQKIWCEGYDWDEPIESDLRMNIMKWFSELPDLNNTKVERTLNFSKEVTSSTVHVFVDASELAYAAVIYIRHELNDSSVEIHFVCSKTKVAPLKAVNIPRLELMGALFGARLARTVVLALKLDMNQVLFWTDSMNVLWWIHRESRCFKPFVANSVGEIHEISPPNQCRYVPSTDNPTDIASRGIAANKLVNSSVWWYGPEFLHCSQESWPEKVMSEHEVTKSEIRQKSSQVEKINVFHSISITGEIVKPERYLDWLRLVRVFGWVLRFVENVKCKVERRKQNELQKDEITNAEVILIHKAQLESYPEEYTCLLKGINLKRNSKLLHLNPVIDKDGLIRRDSRLRNAEFLAYDTRFPIILPRKSWITKLVVKHYHELNHHSGTNQVLSSLSVHYWIEAAREVIRQWEKECSFCKRQRNKLSTQIMAPLPELRLKMPLRAFSHTAVDYAGPFITIQGRGKRREKRYLCLFTCLACRAVHLEMAYGLDTNSFLNAFYRFASRRGLPVLMNSDNGSNFVSADRELKELVQALDTDFIVKKTADKGISWEFNPPNAPHFGGVHEAMIKAAKRAVCKFLQKADVNDEELSTAFVGAEGLLNSRPLTYQSSNPSDDVVLTPNHFLHGQAGGEFAPSSIDITVFDPRKRWRYVQELVKHFWRRWLREFLPTLGSRKKWFQIKRDFKVNDVVVVIDVENPRGHWPLGRIVEVFPGADGHVRVVKVRVGSNILKRPITKLCLLEQSDP